MLLSNAYSSSTGGVDIRYALLLPSATELNSRNTCSNRVLTQRNHRQHNDGKVTSLGFLLGIPMKLSNGITDKNNNQTYIQKGSLGIQAGC